MPVQSLDKTFAPYDSSNTRVRDNTPLDALEVWSRISHAFAGSDLPMPDHFVEAFDRHVAAGLDVGLLQDAIDGVSPDPDRDVLAYALLVLDLATAAPIAPEEPSRPVTSPPAPARSRIA